MNASQAIPSQLKKPRRVMSSPAAPGFAAAAGLDLACLRRQMPTAGVRHDHLFHTVLGLLDVQTALYEPRWDFGAACRRDVLSAATP